MLICFGFMSGAEHKALAGFFMSNPIFTLIPIALWIIYLVKTSSFNTRQIHDEHHNFLFEMCLLPSYDKYLVGIIITTGQLLPVILYGIFITIIGSQDKKYIEIGIVIISIVCLIIIEISHILRKFHNSRKEESVGITKRWLDRNFSKSGVQIVIEHLARTEPGRFFGTKLFTCALIFGCCRLYLFDDYDFRLLALAGSVIGCSLMMTILSIHKFEYLNFPIIRILPIPKWRELLDSILVYLIILLPEIIVLIKNAPQVLSALEISSILIFMVSIMFLLRSILYLPGKPHERISKWLPFLLAFYFLAVLFSINPLWLTVINLCLSILSERLFKNKFEFAETVETTE